MLGRSRVEASTAVGLPPVHMVNVVPGGEELPAKEKQPSWRALIAGFAGSVALCWLWIGVVDPHLHSAGSPYWNPKAIQIILPDRAEPHLIKLLDVPDALSRGGRPVAGQHLNYQYGDKRYVIEDDGGWYVEKAGRHYFRENGIWFEDMDARR